MTSEINRRNTESVFARLREMDVMVRDQQVRINAQDTTISMLQERMSGLEQAVGLLRVAAMGRGPTEGSSG